MRALSLALKFGVELAAFAGFAYWGASLANGAGAVVLALAAPALAMVLWGLFAPPRSRRRLPTGPRVAFELAVFGSAVAALLLAGAALAALILAVLAATSTALLARFDQWEA
ncbi:MAG: hypothetical protein QOF12_1194 [Solirubrobacteraceae bacterium]|nr:hypothetical protein [Solirubrobacteraceae bacterium]